MMKFVEQRFGFFFEIFLMTFFSFNCLYNVVLEIINLYMFIHAMHNAKFALGTWKRIVKTRPVALILNLFLQVCVLFQVKIILKSI